MTTMFEYIKEDIKRYFTPEEINDKIRLWSMLKKVFATEALWIIILYRYGRWLKHETSLPILGPALRMFHYLLYRTFSTILGIHIDSGAIIGKGFYIGHPGSIWIGPVSIGDYCNLSHEVTIGIGGRQLRGVPTIGERVYIGPGAKIFGPIKIGNYVAIGANSVVSKNLPHNAVVVGNPARIVGYKGSTGLIEVDVVSEAGISPTRPSRSVQKRI